MSNLIHLNSEPAEGINGINRQVLSDQVKQYILDSIESGQLVPGERLVESQLARHLHISQAPVREAIRDLVSSGFLVREPHKGTVVRLLTDDDMREIYTVREPLDALAAEQAAVNITEGQLLLLQEILDQMLQAARAEDYKAAARLDWLFHSLIVDISDNNLLRRIYDNLQLGQYTLITMRRSSHSLESLASRHQVVIQALESRDPQVARQAMEQHFKELHPPEDD
jgi:DNA-binding GntR family transcriptional regulator